MDHYLIIRKKIGFFFFFFPSSVRVGNIVGF